jgi:hypothetical protein
MSGLNAFLHDFIRMRKEMTPFKDSSKATGAVKMKPKSRVTYKKDDVPENNSLAQIIEKKPHRREVIEYLQERANTLTEIKMS